MLALFRKENRKMVRKIDISQPPYTKSDLLQIEGVLGNDLEAKLHVINCVLALAVPVSSLVFSEPSWTQREYIINQDNCCNKPLIFGETFETRRVYFLLTSWSSEDEDVKGWWTQEAYRLAVPYITSAHIPFAITQSCGFKQLQRRLEKVVKFYA